MMEKWELPKGWEWVLLARIATNTTRRNPGTQPQKPFQYVEISSVDNLAGVIKLDKVRSLRGSDAPSRARKVIRTGDVLLATTRPYLKNIALVPDALDEEICSTGLCVIRAREGISLPRYVYYACRSDFFVEQLIPKQRGANYPAVTDDDVYESLLPLPYPDDPTRSLEIQRRIVARIEALFAELRAARELHEKVKEDTGRLMDAVLAETFGADATRNWPNEKTLGNLIEINAPLVDPTLPEYRDLPHIHGQVIEEGTGRLHPYRTAAEDGMRSNKYLFRPGSVLYSKIRPNLRKVTIADFEGLCSADMYPLEIKTAEIAPEFLMWALLSPGFTDYAKSLSGRARMPKLNRRQLFSYSLRYPGRMVQDSVVHYLSSVRDEIVEMKRTADENSTLLAYVEQAILAQAFRGEL